MSALGIAAHSGHLEIIRFLAQFVDLNAPSFGGNAPIYSAIFGQQPEAVKLLAYLSKNLPIPLTNGGSTPIEVAEFVGNDEIVAILKTDEKVRQEC